MALNLSSNYLQEVSFIHEVAFNYKTEFYKVHVNVLIEEQETIYKLYVKNNIENPDKSLMKIFKETNDDGSFTWKCKADYFSYLNNEIAATAGAAIDKVLQEKNNKI